MSRRYDRFLIQYTNDLGRITVTEQRLYYENNTGVLLHVAPAILQTVVINDGSKLGLPPRNRRFMRVCRGRGNFRTWNPFAVGTQQYRTFISQFANLSLALDDFLDLDYRGEDNNNTTVVSDI